MNQNASKFRNGKQNINYQSLRCLSELHIYLTDSIVDNFHWSVENICYIFIVHSAYCISECIINSFCQYSSQIVQSDGVPHSGNLVPNVLTVE